MHQILLFGSAVFIFATVSQQHFVAATDDATTTTTTAPNVTNTTTAAPAFQGKYVERPTEPFLLVIAFTILVGMLGGLLFHYCVQSRFQDTFDTGYSVGSAAGIGTKSFAETKASIRSSGAVPGQNMSGALPGTTLSNKANAGLYRGDPQQGMLRDAASEPDYTPIQSDDLDRPHET